MNDENKRKHIEKFFRDFLEKLNIPTKSWYCIVRVMDESKHSMTYYVRFYWATGNCTIENVLFSHGQSIKWDKPVLSAD